MITKLQSRVPTGVTEMSAADYLCRAFPMLGKSRVSSLIRQKQCKLAGARADEKTLLHAGDEVTLYLDGAYDRSLAIVEQDESVIAFIKPRGLPVDADEYGINEDTALSRLRLVYPDARLVHRLDAGTAGLMLAAKNAKSEEELSFLFREHLLEKKYSATVLGRMPKKRDTLKAYLTKDDKHSSVTVSDHPSHGALEIETSYIVRGESTKKGILLSKLEIIIPTGRTHQIRAHMAHIAHPLLGDDKYGDRSANKLLDAGRTDLTSIQIYVFNRPAAGKYAGRRFVLPQEKA